MDARRAFARGRVHFAHGQGQGQFRMSPSRYNGATEHDPGFLRRMWAMVVKEFVQMRRDRMTFATMIFVPILQLTLFGYAINTDPKQLPTAVLVRDDGPLTRAVLAAMTQHRLFRFPLASARSRGARQADQVGRCAIRRGDSRELRARCAAGGPASRAGHRRRHRPRGDGNGDLCRCKDCSTPRSGGSCAGLTPASRRPRRHSSSGCSAATTPKASPNTISCPVCSAWC